MLNFNAVDQKTRSNCTRSFKNHLNVLKRMTLAVVPLLFVANTASAEIINGSFEIRTPAGTGSSGALPTGDCISGESRARYVPAPWGVQSTPDYATQEEVTFDTLSYSRSALSFDTSPDKGCFMGFRSLSNTANEGIYQTVTIADADKPLKWLFDYTEYTQPGRSRCEPEVELRVNGIDDTTLGSVSVGTAPSVGEPGGPTAEGQWVRVESDTFTPSTYGVLDGGTLDVYLGVIANGCSNTWGYVDGVEIVSAAPTDYSDTPADGSNAPDGTVGTSAYGVASHTIETGIQLGATITAENSAVEGADNSSDDGATIPPLILNVGGLVSVDVSGTGGFLQVWIDWNQDGVFSTVLTDGEQLLTDVQDGGPRDADLDLTPNGKITFTVTPALTAPTGTTYARFRWSTEPGLASTGPASDGEVEDYLIVVSDSAPENFTRNTSQGAACLAAGGSLGPTNLFTNLDGGSFGTGSGAVDEIPDTDPYAGQITGGTFVNSFSGFDYGDYTYISNHQTARNASQHGDGIYDPVNGVNGRFFISDPDTTSPTFSNSLSGLTTGKSYEVSFWVADSELNTSNYNRIGVYVSGVEVYETGFIANTTSTMEWKKFSFVYTHNDASTTTALFEIKALESGRSGRDIFFDEINLYECNLDKDLSDAPISGPSPNGLAVNDYGEAIHLISSGIQLGSAIDADTVSIANADASGDDTSGVNDDDGVSAFPTLVASDTSYSIPITSLSASGTGNLYGWIDFNGNGVFDSVEFASTTVTSGTINGALNFSGFGTTASISNTFARFRLTSETLSSDQAATVTKDGEVEDYTVTITFNDYSDAPGYGDAYHGTDGVTYLGTAPDVETASKTTNGDASDDANDDGVFTDSALTAGLQSTSLKPEDSTTLYIPVSGSGKLYAWIDWDANGVFGNNRNELIANGVAGTDETLIVSASIPIAAKLGTTYARFRFSSDAALTEPTGAASDGEVEDYQVTIANTATTPTAPAIAYCSNTWTLDGGVYKTTTSQGVSISASTTAEAGASWSFDPNDALNTAGNFSFAALNGSPSLSTVFTWDTSPEDGRLANAADDDATGTLTFSFGVPVKNPVLHIDRQGGYGSSATANPQGVSNSSIITPNAANASASFTRLAGTTHFEVTSNSIQRTPNETMQDTGVTGASGTDSTLYTAMGSVQVNGTFNSLSLDLNGVGVEGAGADGIEFVICAEPYDYGDAPASYGEAAHKIPDTPVVYLGDVAPDHEPQIQNAANGGSDGVGDDLNGNDDEDAYEKLPAVWTSQSSYRLRVACSDQGAYVAGWVDFNQNNQFDAGERNTDYPTQCNSSGNVTLNWTGLSGLSTGNTYARLRIGSESDEVSTATGTASDGEVEDYPIVLQAPGTPPGACNGELSWLNLAGQPAYPAANWNVNWADRGLNATLDFSTTMTGSNDKWTSASARVFTESNFINRFGSPGYALGLNRPGDGSGTGSTIANIGFDTPLPANTYMVVRDIDATNESITFSNNSLGSLPAPSLWETQSTTELNANNVAWNNPSLFAAWDAAGQQLVTLSDGPNNDQEAYVWPVAGLTDIRVTYQTYAGSANVGFVSCIPQDYGDAPNTYLTTKSATGPQHGIINGVHLGTNTPDTDSDGQPSADANGDGADEDGISSLPTLTSSDRSFSTTVSASNDTANPATLVGWIDFDNNGTLDADEAAIRTIAAGSSNASYTLNWSNIPVDIQTGTSYLRLRLTTDSLSNREPGGAKRDGEVEDYLINITTAGVSVSGRVFNDANVDAVNDSGEIGVTQLPVVLYDTANNVCVSTRTDGSGNYAFKDVAPGTYQVYEASRESVPTPGQCGPANAKDPSSYRSTTNNARDEFTVTTSDIAGQDFGDVKLPVFEPDNTGQILPGNVLFYAHKFTTPAKGSVSFSSVSSGNKSSGWSSIIYRDANCDGQLNQTDGAVPLGTGSLAVDAADNICLINKVYAPANVAANDQYIQNITADFDYGNAIAGDLALKVRDATTAKQVQAPALPATPEVVAEPVTPVQAPVAATPTTPYIPEIPEAPAQAPVAATPVSPAVGPSRLELRKTVKNITQGTAETSTVNSAEPGNTLEYRVYYSNSGTGPVTDLVINDTVPDYTSLKGSPDCGVTLSGMGCSINLSGGSQFIKWVFTGPLIGGAKSSVSYQITIDD